MHSLKIKYDDSQNIKQKQWVLAYQKGDVEAAENLLKEFEPLLYKLSYNLVENQIDEDLLQDLRIVFLEKAKTYKEEKHPSFAGYVKRALGWAKIDCLRKDISYKKAEAFALDNSPEPLRGEIQPVFEEKAVQVLLQQCSFSWYLGKARKKSGRCCTFPRKACTTSRNAFGTESRETSL